LLQVAQRKKKKNIVAKSIVQVSLEVITSFQQHNGILRDMFSNQNDEQNQESNLLLQLIKQLHVLLQVCWRNLSSICE
jgi:hypothetical protein